jgi:hypothetical protein
VAAQKDVLSRPLRLKTDARQNTILHPLFRFRLLAAVRLRGWAERTVCYRSVRAKQDRLENGMASNRAGNRIKGIAIACHDKP